MYKGQKQQHFLRSQELDLILHFKHALMTPQEKKKSLAKLKKCGPSFIFLLLTWTFLDTPCNKCYISLLEPNPL